MAANRMGKRGVQLPLSAAAHRPLRLLRGVPHSIANSPRSSGGRRRCPYFSRQFCFRFASAGALQT